MKKNVNNNAEGLQSRREFFRKAAHKALPLLGLAVVGPSLFTSCTDRNDCKNSCEITCEGSCSGSCSTGCEGSAIGDTCANGCSSTCKEVA